MKKQLLKFYVLLVIVTILTSIAYFYFRENWIIFAKAERDFEKKDFNKAIIAYEKALKNGFQNKDLYIHLGDSYTSEREFKKAASLYRSYLSQHPEDRMIQLRLARVLSYSGNFDESTKEYQKLLNTSNRSPNEK